MVSGTDGPARLEIGGSTSKMLKIQDNEGKDVLRLEFEPGSLPREGTPNLHWKTLQVALEKRIQQSHRPLGMLFDVGFATSRYDSSRQNYPYSVDRNQLRHFNTG